MATKTMLKKAIQADKSFHLAVTALGAKAIAAMIRLWLTETPSDKPEVLNSFLNKATDEAMSRRHEANDLAVAYYKYQRALRTDRSISLYEPNSNTTLQDLRMDFQRRTQVARSQGSTTPQRAIRFGPSASQEDVLTDQIANLEREIERDDREAEAELRRQLKKIAKDAEKQKRKLKKATKTALKQIDKEAWSKAALESQKQVLDGARDVVGNALTRDQEVTGWVRVSRTGTPCGFCAMLIARGPVYKTKASANFKADGDAYHGGCNCIVIPVYDVEQYDDPMFDLNREYEKLWPEVTRGYTGKKALSVWRKHFRTKSGT